MHQLRSLPTMNLREPDVKVNHHTCPLIGTDINIGTCIFLHYILMFNNVFIPPYLSLSRSLISETNPLKGVYGCGLGENLINLYNTVPYPIHAQPFTMPTGKSEPIRKTETHCTLGEYEETRIKVIFFL